MQQNQIPAEQLITQIDRSVSPFLAQKNCGLNLMHTLLMAVRLGCIPGIAMALMALDYGIRRQQIKQQYG